MKLTTGIITASLLVAATGRAEQVSTVGPLRLCEGRAVSLTVYNTGPETVAGTVELIDLETGLTIDRQATALPGQRGGSVGFSNSRVFAAGTPQAKSGTSCESPKVVVAITAFSAPPGTVLIGDAGMVQPAQGQRTIIGGFKSVSGMSSTTEVIEYSVSEPFHIDGPAVLRGAVLGGQGTMLVEVIRVSDGAVVSAATASASSQRKVVVRGWNPKDKAPVVGSSSAHVLRLTALTGGVVAAVSVESEAETAYLTAIHSGPGKAVR